jgi:16S rRNA (uracil1498-N3)-methyltransferase
MTRIFHDHPIGENSTITLTGEKVHYLSTVLRSAPGDTLIVSDPSGAAYLASVAGITKKSATLEIQKRCEPAPESPIEITLIQGLLKGDKMDLVIQKSSELGVRQLLPAITGRSQIRETRKLLRWQKIAEEASRQCGRSAVTRILEPREFSSALQIFDPRQMAGIIFWEQSQSSFSSALDACREKKHLALCVGPEGGFSEQEVTAAAAKGFSIASLGKRTLRAETAAIAAVSIVQFVLGDLSGQT